MGGYPPSVGPKGRWDGSGGYIERATYREANKKLMLNTLWGKFENRTGTWQRLETMRRQTTEAPLACRAAVDTQERLDPRVKCGLWRWAIT